jgi:hypothetical protein
MTEASGIPPRANDEAVAPPPPAGEPGPAPTRRSLARTVGRPAALVVTGLLFVILAAWGAGAIYYWPAGSHAVRAALAILFSAGTALAFLFIPNRLRTLLAFLGVFAVVLFFYSRIRPSNNREWSADVARLPTATIDGDLVTFRNIRDSEYRTAEDFTPRYYDRTFDIRKLASADLVVSYWAGEAIAHIFVSFGFGDQGHIAISAETRKEKGEGYSTLAGFFRNYELIYLLGDERDLIRVRTNYRRPEERVYLYRLHPPRENLVRFFTDYVETLQRLEREPEFYNTLTTNCATNFFIHTRANPKAPPWSWQILASGYIPEYAYKLGAVDTALPFDELKRRSLVNDAAHEADEDADFSRRIREGRPGM